jgi:hypothetical protein
MTAPWWFVVAGVLTLAGFLLLALAYRGRPLWGPRSTLTHVDHERGSVEGYGPNGAHRRTEGALFEPATDPTPQPPTHWHTGDNP